MLQSGWKQGCQDGEVLRGFEVVVLGLNWLWRCSEPMSRLRRNVRDTRTLDFASIEGVILALEALSEFAF